MCDKKLSYRKQIVRRLKWYCLMFKVCMTVISSLKVIYEYLYSPGKSGSNKMKREKRKYNKLN